MPCSCFAQQPEAVVDGRNGVDLRMAGIFQKRGKAARPLSGSRNSPDYGRP